MKNQSLSLTQVSKFKQKLKNIYQLLQQQEYQKCEGMLNSFDSSEFQNIENKIQILSLKGYILSLQKKYQQSLDILDECIKLRPYHLASKKRRALALEKLGQQEECLKQFKQCLWLEPQSKSLKNKIKRLSFGSAKSQSVSSQGNILDQKVQAKIVKQQVLVQEINKQKSNSVKFGNFEIIEVAGTEDSDQHFAMIKEEIGKILEKKPKKSILKDTMSASIFKQKPKQKDGKNWAKAIQKVENAQQKMAGQAKEQKGNQTQSKMKSKKKSKSVTFKGDTNLEDFN